MHVSHTYLHTYLRVYLQDQFLKEELLSQWIHAFLNLIDTVKLPSKGVVRIHSPSKQFIVESSLKKEIQSENVVFNCGELLNYI